VIPDAGGRDAGRNGDGPPRAPWRPGRPTVLRGGCAAAITAVVTVAAAARFTPLAALPVGALGIVAVGAALVGGRVGLRERFLFGIPWGTLVALVGVLAVYIGVQGGGDGAPAAIPFTAWSYLYPTGVALAGFSHANLGHLTGNLAGTLAFAPIAEYAWGHYPRRRGAVAFGAPVDTPYVRAFVLFPVAVVAVGVSTALFAWGPIIGFSGVVFAFAGVALVHRPLATVLAVVGQRALRLLYDSLRAPIVEATPGPSFSRPWWAGTAIQGHLLGLLIGVGIGVALLRWRDERPSGRRLWIGAALLGVALNLWTVWWFRGDGFVLYRAPGAVLVVAVATVVTVAAVTLVGDRGPPDGLGWRHLGLLLLVLPLAVMAGVAVPTGLVTASDAGGVDATVTVRDYRIGYAEGVPNGYASLIEPPDEVFGVDVPDDVAAEVRSNASGVIVVSDRRQVWTEAASAGELASRGRDRVVVGGLGWRETVSVRREGWTPSGNRTVYTVWLGPENAQSRPAFNSSAARAAPTVRGRNVTVTANASGGFRLAVTRSGRALGTAPLPAADTRTEAGGLGFVRDDRRVVAVAGNTTVTIATRETY
jgi:membrane associated rhomboid family serine protease